jgi:hypothetical protein
MTLPWHNNNPARGARNRPLYFGKYMPGCKAGLQGAGRSMRCQRAEGVGTSGVSRGLKAPAGAVQVALLLRPLLHAWVGDVASGGQGRRVCGGGVVAASLAAAAAHAVAD